MSTVTLAADLAFEVMQDLIDLRNRLLYSSPRPLASAATIDELDRRIGTIEPAVGYESQRFYGVPRHRALVPFREVNGG